MLALLAPRPLIVGVRQLMTVPQKALINDFVNRSFRDVADRDYLSARILYRYDLGPQFLWAALQSLEKYLKAILLYNHRSTKGLGHNLSDAYNRVRSISDIPFDFPRDIDNFVTYLTEEGANRYFEYPSYTLGEELLSLDRAVWYIRRYCRQLRTTLRKPSGEHVDLFPYELKRIAAWTPERAHKVSLFGGFLEDVLRKRGSQLREHLVWKNFYFGAYKKHVIKRYRLHSWSAHPTHYMHPEAFALLDPLVQFSKPVRAVFLKPKHKK